MCKFILAILLSAMIGCGQTSTFTDEDIARMYTYEEKGYDNFEVEVIESDDPECIDYLVYVDGEWDLYVSVDREYALNTALK